MKKRILGGVMLMPTVIIITQGIAIGYDISFLAALTTLLTSICILASFVIGLGLLFDW